MKQLQALALAGMLHPEGGRALHTACLLCAVFLIVLTSRTLSKSAGYGPVPFVLMVEPE
jgi:hypothetical protein